jgi:hypothetical protein
MLISCNNQQQALPQRIKAKQPQYNLIKLTTGMGELKTVRFDQSVNKGIGERSLKYRKSKGKRRGKGLDRRGMFIMQEATLSIA